jgi:hypothetical protein
MPIALAFGQQKKRTGEKDSKQVGGKSRCGFLSIVVVIAECLGGVLVHNRSRRGMRSLQFFFWKRRPIFCRRLPFLFIFIRADSSFTALVLMEIPSCEFLFIRRMDCLLDLVATMNLSGLFVCFAQRLCLV